MKTSTYSETMIKIFLPFILFGIFLGSCSNSAKEYFSDKDNNFKVLFPGKPTASDRTILFPFGSFSGKKFTYEASGGSNKSYSVTCIKLPENIVHSDSLNLLSQLFALTQADYIQQFGESGLQNTFIKSIDKYPGREFVWGNPRINEGYTRRAYYIKNMLYLLEVAYTTSNQHNVEIASFLDSFELLNKDTNPNPEPVPPVPQKRFTISYPGVAVSKKQVVAGANGPEYVVTEMYQVNTNNQLDEFGNSGYGVNYMDFQNHDVIQMTEDLQKKFIYESSTNNPLVLNGGKVLSINESTIDGTWCVELKALGLGGRIEFTAKTFFKDKYLYQVMVLSAPNKSDNEAARKFMESFHYK